MIRFCSDPGCHDSDPGCLKKGFLTIQRDPMALMEVCALRVLLVISAFRGLI